MPPPRRKRSAARSPHFSWDYFRQNGLRMIWHALVLGVVWGGFLLLLVVGYYAYDMPSIKDVEGLKRRPSVTLIAADGNVFARLGDQVGETVTVATLPRWLPQAVVAIEDRRFYSHIGVDPLGLIRAFFVNIRAGHRVQGGSTLTQQLAKNLFLSPEKTVRRKVQEVLLALWLERTYSKNDILSAYLNRVYLGAGTYGVDAAARTYFNKSARTLSLQESAIIAGLLKAPSRYSPLENRAEAETRARVVLKAMEDVGFITPQQRADAANMPPTPRRKPGSAGDGLYFADWVADEALAMLGTTPRDIVVKTTLNIDLQRDAERALTRVMVEKGAAMKASEAALITLAEDGAIRAMIGGTDYRDSEYNRAVKASRQPGSSFKPFVYLAALESGYSQNSLVQDAPIRIGKWAPENYTGKYEGQVTLAHALAHSLNTATVRLAQDVGVEKVRRGAMALGITSPLNDNLSIALGTSEVNLLELTGAYATLATGGRAVMPYAILEISDRQGRVLYRRPNIARSPYVVPRAAVADLTAMMQGVLTEGTGMRAALPGRSAAGKTGTTQDYRDAWFVGFTADYTTGVWVGNDDNSPMKRVTGGSLPAEIWHDVMLSAEANLPPRLLPGLFADSDSAPASSSDGGGESGSGFERFLEGIIGR
jgi:penicillin-binding protein 1A